MILKYLKNRLKWKIAPYFNFKYPQHIDIELNNTCNQKCVMCWHSQKKLPFKKKTMDYIEASGLIIQASELGVSSIKFNLRGEPTIHPELILCLKLAKHHKLYTMINTNGTKLNSAIFNYLDECIISLDSLNPATYYKIHGEDQLNLIYSAIGLARLCPQTKVKLNWHVSKLNEHEKIPQEINGFPVVVRYTEKRKGSDISIPRNRKRKMICPHMMRRLTVLSNGKVYPCCVCYDEPEDILLGHIKGEHLSEIWDGDARKELIERYARKDFPKTCQNCTSGDVWKS